MVSLSGRVESLIMWGYIAGLSRTRNENQDKETSALFGKGGIHFKE